MKAGEGGVCHYTLFALTFAKSQVCNELVVLPSSPVPGARARARGFPSIIGQSNRAARPVHAGQPRHMQRLARRTAFCGACRANPRSYPYPRTGSTYERHTTPKNARRNEFLVVLAYFASYLQEQRSSDFICKNDCLLHDHHAADSPHPTRALLSHDHDCHTTAKGSFLQLRTNRANTPKKAVETC